MPGAAWMDTLDLWCHTYYSGGGPIRSGATFLGSLGGLIVGPCHELARGLKIQASQPKMQTILDH